MLFFSVFYSLSSLLLPSIFPIIVSTSSKTSSVNDRLQRKYYFFKDLDQNVPREDFSEFQKWLRTDHVDVIPILKQHKGLVEERLKLLDLSIDSFLKVYDVGKELLEKKKVTKSDLDFIVSIYGELTSNLLLISKHLKEIKNKQDIDAMLSMSINLYASKALRTMRSGIHELKQKGLDTKKLKDLFNQYVDSIVAQAEKLKIPADDIESIKIMSLKEEQSKGLSTKPNQSLPKEQQKSQPENGEGKSDLIKKPDQQVQPKRADDTDPPYYLIFRRKWNITENTIGSIYSSIHTQAIEKNFPTEEALKVYFEGALNHLIKMIDDAPRGSAIQKNSTRLKGRCEQLIPVISMFVFLYKRRASIDIYCKSDFDNQWGVSDCSNDFSSSVFNKFWIENLYQMICEEFEKLKERIDPDISRVYNFNTQAAIDDFMDDPVTRFANPIISLVEQMTSALKLKFSFQAKQLATDIEKELKSMENALKLRTLKIGSPYYPSQTRQNVKIFWMLVLGIPIVIIVIAFIVVVVIIRKRKMSKIPTSMFEDRASSVALDPVKG